MNFIKEFLQEYGFSIVYTILASIAAFFAAKIKSIYQNQVDDKTKRKDVEACVKAVEQLYSELAGSEKLAIAKRNAVEMLQVKGISITEIELDMLIESIVAEFNFNDLKIKDDEEALG